MKTASPRNQPEAGYLAPASTLSATNGLVARSWAKVDIGPWPGTKRVSPPIGHRRWAMLSSRS